MRHQKKTATIALAILACFFLGTPAHAAVVNPGDNVRFTFAPYHAPGFVGGAFSAYDSTTGSSWFTFCLEYSEHIALGTTYVASSVELNAIQGGVGNSGIPGVAGKSGASDPISSQTALLYYLYATGGIVGDTTGAVVGAGTGAQQTALQDVFWYLENEITTLPSNAYTADYLKIAQQAKIGEYYGVLVVNPVDLAGGVAQSQLVYVPEPGSLLLLGSGLLGLFGYRRSRRTA